MAGTGGNMTPASGHVSTDHSVRGGTFSRIVVIACGLVGALISFAWSWRPSLWSDEVATVRAARLDWVSLVEFVGHKDAVHALYYALMHVWIDFFGSSELSLRAPSAMAIGCATAGLVILGIRMQDQRLGLLAAAVFVVLPRTTYMGAEARSYAITAALAVWAVIALLWCSSQPRRLPWLVYVATIIASTGLFIYSLLLLPVHAVYLLSSRPSKSVKIRWVASVAIAIAVSAPFLAAVASQKGQISWLADQNVVNVWSIVVEPFFDSSFGTAGVVVVLMIIAVSIPGTRRRLTSMPLFPLAAAWTLLPLVLLLIANTIDGPLFLARYLSFCAPGAALLIALALRSFERRWLPVAGLLLIVVVSVPTYVSQRSLYAKNGGSDLAEVAAYIQKNSREGDAIFFSETGPSTLRPRLALYGYPHSFERVSDIGLLKPFNNSGRWSFSDTTAALSQLAGTLQTHSRLWYLRPGQNASCDNNSDIRFLHNAGYRLIERSTTNRETICEFLRNP
ncbi:hypothetical protein [Lacisediminihabitans sp. H27-G8]|uniref:glycosyltransferase family 39 protein n=1 Tax=Lacisediminihabitans sp. H27-G8 TaxID=3111909 RepID=UPI0038FBF19C